MLGIAKYRMHWLGILLALIAADAHAQATGSNAKVITWQPATPNSEVYAGILGEIAKPGVYRLEATGLSLQNVIRRAGGLTEEASGTIRIVRQDRIVESFFFNPQANIALLAGDLLVIESKRTQAALSKLYEADPQLRATYAKSGELIDKPARPRVWVAFVNVLDRPVIVPVKLENARVGHLVQMLDQPIELAQAVRVIGPDRLLSQNAAPQPIDASLADGTVLVFPRNSINRAKLPSLPIPYESEIATGASPAIIGGSPELRNVGQLPFLGQQSEQPARFSSPPATMEPVTLPAAPVISQPLPTATERLEIPQAIQAPLVSSPPRIATIPFTGERRIASSSRHRPSAPDREPVAVAEPKRTAIRDSSDESDSSESKSESEQQAKEADDPFLDEEASSSPSGKGSSLSLSLIVGVFTISGLLIGLALLTRRYFERRQSLTPGILDEIDAVFHQRAAKPMTASPIIPAVESAPIAIPQKPAIESERTAGPLASTWFSQLLKNQLPIRSEKAEFPADIALQGRLVPQPVFRVDAAAEPLSEGPHFAASDSAPSSEAIRATSEQKTDQVVESVEAAHSSHPSKPHFLKRRPGENTIAAAAAANAARATVGSESIPQPDLKHSTTPVADALRHLQGGQQ
ncbi:MAG: hypothetical protein JWP89_706 [Schlesneria sp.]|nr:hypothetical protein [Schlesneria sp.]